MTIKSESHITALTDLVEVISILGAVGLGVDIVWCVRDFIEQGYPIGLMFVMGALTLVDISIVYAIVKYHNVQQRKILSTLLHEKLKICKRKQKRRHNEKMPFLR